MNSVICYPHCCVPNVYDENTWYFEVFSSPKVNLPNVGHIGVQFVRDIKKSHMYPSREILDFLMIAFSVVAADKAVLRKESADGWTREIALTIYVYEKEKWKLVKSELEKMLRFLSGDFWNINFLQLSAPVFQEYDTEKRENDCVCLLSGGMDSLVGAIDLHEEGHNPLFVAQTVRGDAEHQREYAEMLGKNNLCQWSNSVKKKGKSENTTRTRSIVFFAFALLASMNIKSDERGRRKIIVPENGFISLNPALDPLRIGSLSTKTTHPVYMDYLQRIWDIMGYNVDLILPYKYLTKGEVLLNCKNQDLMKAKIFGSTSCGKYQRHGLRHCGVCVPCMVRRAAFLRSGLPDNTEKGYCVEDLSKSDSRDVAAAMYASIQSERAGTDSIIQGSLNFANSEEYIEFSGVIERGIEEIRTLLQSQEAL